MAKRGVGRRHSPRAALCRGHLVPFLRYVVSYLLKVADFFLHPRVFGVPVGDDPNHHIGISTISLTSES